jgi:O-antigen ligase
VALAACAGGLFQVVFGARALGSPTIWGQPVTGGADRLRGTFVNPDHLAFYLGLALPVAFAWVFWALRRARREGSLERILALAAPPAIVWLTLFVGLAFTGSRAGLLAAAAAVLAQGALLTLASRRPRWLLGGAAALAAGLALVAMVGMQQGLGRWLGTSAGDLAARMTVSERALDLFARFPWLGAGLAAFRDGFPLVQGGLAARPYWHAHNDYAELLATAGVAGAVAVAVGAWAALRRLLPLLASPTQRSENRAAALAALGALVAVAVHSLVDFGLSMPANAATLAILLGCALAAGDGRLTPAGDQAPPGRRGPARRA